MNSIEVKYQPERSMTFLGSPSIVRLSDGALLATHDYFGPGCPRNHEAEESLTSVYRSEDNGECWQNITHVMNCYWGTLFTHQNSVYILGVTQQYGSIVIRRSDDGGFTWTKPIDEKSGLLFRGGAFREAPNYHCAPLPVLMHEGKLYKAFEDCTSNEWGKGFKACVASAPLNTNLLEASNWEMSNKLAFDAAWIPSDWGTLENPGWLEGNIVVSPDGNLFNILRLNSSPIVDKAAMIRVDQSGKNISFNPATGFIDFPGGMTKFTIRREPRTGIYLSLVNNNTDPTYSRQRNILSLSASRDLQNWFIVKTLMTDDSGLSHQDSIRLTGFQYVEWQFDGEDIIYLVRSAYRGARNYHDSNRIHYRVLRNYMEILGVVT